MVELAPTAGATIERAVDQVKSDLMVARVALGPACSSQPLAALVEKSPRWPTPAAFKSTMTSDSAAQCRKRFEQLFAARREEDARNMSSCIELAFEYGLPVVPAAVRDVAIRFVTGCDSERPGNWLATELSYELWLRDESLLAPDPQRASVELSKLLEPSGEQPLMATMSTEAARALRDASRAADAPDGYVLVEGASPPFFVPEGTRAYAGSQRRVPEPIGHREADVLDYLYEAIAAGRWSPILERELLVEIARAAAMSRPEGAGRWRVLSFRHAPLYDDVKALDAAEPRPGGTSKPKGSPPAIEAFDLVTGLRRFEQASSDDPRLFVLVYDYSSRSRKQRPGPTRAEVEPLLPALTRWFAARPRGLARPGDSNPVF